MPPPSARDAVDVAIGDRLGVVDDPVQAIERHVAIDLLVDIEDARDAFVVGGVDAERPAILRKQAHDRFELAFHARRQLRARLAEILEVGRGEHEHFAGAVVAQHVVALRAA